MNGWGIAGIVVAIGIVIAAIVTLSVLYYKKTHTVSVVTATAAPTALTPATLAPVAAQNFVQNLATASLAAQTAVVAPGTASTATTQAVPTTTAPLIAGRFVKLSNPAIGCLNITEIQVYSQPGGANLATGKVITKSSGYPPGADVQPASNALDGDFGTYTQTSCVEAPWLMVDLGAVIPIYSVAVYNRMDGNCGTRTTGSIITILNGTGQTVYTSAPFPDKQGNTTPTNSCGTALQPFGTFFVLPPNTAVNGT